MLAGLTVLPLPPCVCHVPTLQDVRIEACQLLGDMAREAAYEVCGCVCVLYVCGDWGFRNLPTQSTYKYNPNPTLFLFFALLCFAQPAAKVYALALVRALLPSLRHPLARVRAAALGAIGAVVAVPDRAKCKGAGSAAIEELVGFRPDNVLSVAAFYRVEVDVNYLAEVRGRPAFLIRLGVCVCVCGLVHVARNATSPRQTNQQLVRDPRASVRMRLLEVLGAWLRHLPDRRSHDARLVPYLLTLLNDPIQVRGKGRATTSPNHHAIHNPNPTSVTAGAGAGPGYYRGLRGAVPERGAGAPVPSRSSRRRGQRRRKGGGR